MWSAQTVSELRRQRNKLAGGLALVPTMGALHRGHMSLVEKAKALADNVIVSIFVNPTQFGPNEDFAEYPQQLEPDLAACRAAEVTGVFHPGVQELYPPGLPACQVNVPALARPLEGEFRPGHFEGVCRVVLKLLNATQPDFACFGEKDYQQLRVVQAMTADLNLPIEIVACPTVRQDDGIALSSRNDYLHATQRRHALGLFKALGEAKMLIEQAGETDPKRVESSMHQVLKAHHLQVDYAAVRHPLTLEQLDCIDPALTGGVVALVAGRIAGVRLIDNMLLGATEAAPE